MIFLAILPVFSSFANLTIPISGAIQYRVFQLRGAGVSINHFHPSAVHYQPNAWNIIKDLGINVIRVWGGVEGNVWGIHMKNNPNWAQNLDAFLSEADSHGVKVMFHALGDGWGTLFGIVSPPLSGAVSIEEAKAMIDQLAGDNALGHNFITDPRVIGWRSSNELDISDSYVLQWNLEICDYIRSKGGKAWISAPRYESWWTGEKFSVIEPLVRGHVDYLELHGYECEKFEEFGRDYNSFYDYYKNFLQGHMIDGRGEYSIDQLILGEFGIWRGSGQDLGFTSPVSFTDEDRETYYRALFDACRDVGIKNVIFHELFAYMKEPPWTEYNTPVYGIVDVDGTYFPLAADVIREAYRTS